MNVQELLHMLDVLSSKSDHGGHERKPLARQNTAHFAPNTPSQPPPEQSGSEETIRASISQPSPSEQLDGSNSAPRSALASADILRVWRSSKQEDVSAIFDAEISETHSTSDLDWPSAPPASAATGRPSDTLLSSGVFSTSLRAAGPGCAPPPAGASSSASKFTSVFDAAALFFPDVDRAQAAGALDVDHRAMFDTSTVVQRVIRQLGGSAIHALREPENARDPLEARATTVAVSQDGQEVLWMRSGGRWCSFFIRDIKNLIPGSAGLSSSSCGASLADSCVFGVELPGRILEFKAESSHAMQLWLVGLLALLESASSVVASLRIWRSLAPWLTRMSSATGTADKIFDVPDFPPCIENFMQEFFQESKKSSAPQPLIAHEPMMAGSFLRRVITPQLVIFMQTSVMLGDSGLVLADPYSGAEVARCDFRKESGIMTNRVEFLPKHGMQPPRDSGGLEGFSYCMEIKDTFGASHTILLPSEAAASEWEAGVSQARALPHNALADRLRQSVASGGVRALLRSLDQFKPEHAFGLVGELPVAPNSGDEEPSARDMARTIVGAADAHAASSFPDSSADAHAASSFPDSSAPAAQHAVPVASSQLSLTPASVEETPPPSRPRALDRSALARSSDVSTTPELRTRGPQPHAAQGRSVSFSQQQPDRSPSPPPRPLRVSSGSSLPHSQQTSRADITPQSRADITPQSRADITPQSRADITPQSRADITPQSRADITPQSRADITPQSRADITPQSRADITPQSRANNDRSNSNSQDAISAHASHPEIRSRMPLSPPQLPRSPAAAASSILLRYEHGSRDVQTLAPRPRTGSAPAAASSSPGCYLVTPTASSRGQLAADRAAADVADRINSAIAGFASFRR